MRAALPDARVYVATPAKSGRLTGFRVGSQPLSEAVRADICGAVESLLGPRKPSAPASDLEREVAQQQRFLSVRSSTFVPRGDDFAALDAYHGGASDRPLLLVAPAGAGKTTLLAKWIARQSDPAEVFFRFVGGGDRSGSVGALLRLLLSEIERDRQLGLDLPDADLELRAAFPELLRRIGAASPALIVVDSLDQLDKGLADVSWVPSRLPQGIKLVLSADSDIEDEDGLEVLSKRTELRELPLPFEPGDRRTLVAGHLARYLRRLDDSHIDALVANPASASPLYLEVVLTELRASAGHKDLGAHIQTRFRNTPITAFEAVLERLQSHRSYSTAEREYVAPALCAGLAFARRGLSVQEVADLVHRAAPELSRSETLDAIHLYLHELRPYLARWAGRYGYLHRSLSEAARRRAIGPKDRTEMLWHSKLAEVFAASPEAPERGTSRRALAERPYHLTRAHQWEPLERLLTDIQTIEAFARADMIDELLAHYQRAHASAARWEAHADVATFERFVSKEAHLLRRHPEQVLQQALNEPDGSPVCRAAVALARERGPATVWMRRINKAREETPVRFSVPSARAASMWSTLCGPGMLAVGTRDGRISTFDLGTGRILREARVANVDLVGAAYSARTDRLYALGSTGRIRPLCPGTLRVHEEPDLEWSAQAGLDAIRPCGDSLLATAGPDAFVLRPGGQATRLPGHFAPIDDACATNDGRRVATVAGDTRVQVSDAISGELLWQSDAHHDHVTACAFSPDGELLVTGSWSEIVVWEAGGARPARPATARMGSRRSASTSMPSPVSSPTTTRRSSSTRRASGIRARA